MPPACVFGVFAVVFLCAWEVVDGIKRTGEGQRDEGSKTERWSWQVLGLKVEFIPLLGLFLLASAMK